MLVSNYIKKLNLVLALVGNKAEEYINKQVTDDEAKIFAKEINAIFMLIDKYDDKPIKDLFRDIGKKYLNQMIIREKNFWEKKIS